MRNIFGWDLPPGCSQRMIDEQCNGPCDVCGRPVDVCVCPECPTCGDCGNPHCYEEHGLVHTQEQIDSRREANETIERENKFWEDYATKFPGD